LLGAVGRDGLGTRDVVLFAIEGHGVLLF
jgi:hypothetical protein